jgi:predicted NACHT family NTPase
MGGRSLKASSVGVQKARLALISQGLSQERFAEIAAVSRSTVVNFFTGKPVDRQLFVELCKKLNLAWKEIAEVATPTSPDSSSFESDKLYDANELVQEVRQRIQHSIQEKCGNMRVLDMEQPIDLDDIYTNVNILEKITGRQRLAIADLLKESSTDNFERFGLSSIREEKIQGLEAVQRHSKLMILGKPGSGKTTFLKHLAIQCVSGKFLPDKIPIFITLKDFAENDQKISLIDYIVRILYDYGLESNTKVRANFLSSLFGLQKTALEQLLGKGKFIILLDGLDEVKELDAHRILYQIQDFTDRFHLNQIVITCRIASREYTFEQFVEVEISDFDAQQISNFVNKWFQVKKDSIKAELFLKTINDDKPTQELATSPLLLTLLCLVFEDLGNFPSNRSELYKEGLDILLKRWDSKRNIQRDGGYKKLSLQRKEDLLSQIAFETFQNGNYFFKQKDIERKISDYICNILGADTAPEQLELDSEAVLKSIEGQHGLLVERAKGIYSFSHLTFHEYFVARKITTDPYSVQEGTLENLITHIQNKRWQEVVILTVGMLPKADHFVQLMKAKVDNFLIKDVQLQKFLDWIEKKSYTVDSPYKSSAIRAFYFTLSRIENPDFMLARKLDPYLDSDFNFKQIRNSGNKLSLAGDLAYDLVVFQALNNSVALTFNSNAYERSIELDNNLKFICSQKRDLDFLNLDLARNRIYAQTSNFDEKSALARAIKLARAHTRDNIRTYNIDFQKSVQKLKDQIPDPKEDKSKSKKWWQNQGKIWTENFRILIIKYRNLGHEWLFSDTQTQLLQQYYDTNKLLISCLNSDCYVSRELRQSIEETILLPFTSNLSA